MEIFNKRSLDQIKKIKSRVGDPFSIKNFLSSDEIDYLVKLYDQSSDLTISQYQGKIKKNTGPITLEFTQFVDDPIIEKILEKLKKVIGDFEITAALFFKTDYPHIIHNDDTYELPEGVYKGITLPLKAYGTFSEFPKLCFFDQMYFHGPAKFFNESEQIPTYYNRQIYDYSDIDGLTFEESIDYDSYFTHLNPKWLKGLSLHSTLDWVPGDALIFDSIRLHCASDFRKLGIKEKLAISIFTKTND